ncbi:hypothetical protein JRO89_XS11G0171000 [Xanthoceras sorbifolium]|uniref:Cytochrome P450 704C1-like n=1 Tax=Xanthoceras sorbifolium TaxID=99658 RepID=A0ABQ8HFX9_9ROSI|nr:hypothetical protein JRO89_XS11G0171000 [Xanthoceras sorbifolium]
MMFLKDFISINHASLPATILAVFLAVLILTKLQARKSTEKRKRYHPIGSTILQQISNFHRLHDFLTDLACNHKTFRLLSFFKTEVYTSDPANVEYILKTNFPNYGKGSYAYNNLTDLLGDGIFVVDGEKWRHQRKFASYEFSTKILRDFSSEVFKTNALKLARVVSEAAASKRSIEIQDLFMKSTLDSVFKVLLGVELDGMCGTSEEGTRFSEAFDTASAMVRYRYVDVFWKIKRFLNIGSEAVLRKCVKDLDEFVYKIIKSKIEQVQNSHTDLLGKKEDVLSRFLELKETNQKYLRDIILSFVIAGKDTTSSTLSWFFYLICKYPDIQEKIAKEVMEATQLGHNSSIEEFATRITEETIDKMQYLHATLTETLRLYPAVPLDGKMCFSDDTLPDGYNVKKGDYVAYLPYAMGRMRFIWGDDAEEFRPERWLDENSRFESESPFKFTAFQAGPRICLGKEFAYRQMKIFCMLLLGYYRFKLSDEKKTVKYRTMLTLAIDGGGCVGLGVVTHDSDGNGLVRNAWMLRLLTVCEAALFSVVVKSHALRVVTFDLFVKATLDSEFKALITWGKVGCYVCNA